MYICSTSDNAQPDVLKNFLSSNIAAPSTMQQGHQKHRPSHTFVNIKTKGSHSFQGTSLLRGSYGSVLSKKYYWDISYKTIMVAAAKMLI